MTNQESEASAFPTWWAAPARELAEQIGTGLSEGLESEQVEEHRRQ
jgi:hypothetical protein